MKHRILVINPGSTSTKVALYEDENQVYAKTLEYSTDELIKFKDINDQFDFRFNSVIGFLEENNIAAADLTCVVSRGGFLPPVKGRGI